MGSQTHHIELVNQKKVSEKYSTIQWIELEKRHIKPTQWGSSKYEPITNSKINNSI
jgi:hypothetical protein